MAHLRAMLLPQGAADPRIAASDSLELAAKLSDLEHDLALKLCKGGSHSLIENRAEFRAETYAWLERHLASHGGGTANVSDD